MNYFAKNLRNEIALASTETLMRSQWYEWYQKCCADPNEPMLKEEAKAIKARLQYCSLDCFSASDGWLDGLKTAYAIKEHRIVGEDGDVSEEGITSWMKDYRN